MIGYGSQLIYIIQIPGDFAHDITSNHNIFPIKEAQ